MSATSVVYRKQHAVVLDDDESVGGVAKLGALELHAVRDRGRKARSHVSDGQPKRSNRVCEECRHVRWLVYVIEPGGILEGQRS